MHTHSHRWGVSEFEGFLDDLGDAKSCMVVKISSSAAMASEAVLEVAGLVGDLSRRSGLCGVTEARDASRVAEDSKEVLRSGASRLLSVGPGSQQCSRSTSSDGTPITVSHHIAAELQRGTAYRRSGKLRCDSAILWTCCKSQAKCKAAVSSRGSHGPSGCTSNRPVKEGPNTALFINVIHEKCCTSNRPVN